MSDTDTDDTDLLLLIPPNYYTDTAERLMHEAKMSAAAAAASDARFDAPSAAAADALAMPPPALPAPTTAAYQFLMPSKKTELNHINARLQNMELDQEDDRRFEAPSDLSTISSSTVRTAFGGRKQRTDVHGVVSSTPKSGSVEPLRHHRAEDNMLLEIDNYLDDRHQHHHSDDHLRMRAHPAPPHRRESDPALPIMRMGATSDNRLISLSDLWGKSHTAGTVIPNNMTTLQGSPSLKEEQLRRQHLEKMVQTLQGQLLEYQQRMSVAIEVDRSKDGALHQADQQVKTLNFEVQHLRDSLHRVEAERIDNHNRCDALQHELAQAVGLATKFQEKTEKLESELDHSKRQLTESTKHHEELELQLQSSKRAEELSHAELNKLRDRFAKADYQQEKLRATVEDLEKDKSTLQQQKEMLQEYHQKQKSRADSLETQRKSMQDALANLTEIESNLKKKLEVQQKSLKQHYQQQLENVVAKKLQEFQAQLDKSEELLKSEARERERLIADRAVKQLEMINEKNNLELNLIQEKHSEEVELYRLQLANASKKLEELELKLSGYKTKRADIAEKLHGVMEAQWQQALAILTSPNQTFQLETDNDESAADLNTARHFPETPKSNNTQRSNNTEKNNLDVVAKKDPPSPMDKLQAYIELLLSKSPSDLDKLDEILALSTKQNTKPSKRGPKPPPWKA